MSGRVQYYTSNHCDCLSRDHLQHGSFRTLELLLTLVYFPLPTPHDMHGTCMLLTLFAWLFSYSFTLLFTMLGTTEFMYFME